MQLEHSFTVPVGVEDAFRILRDIERVAPCMPGATLDSVEGDEFTGRVKVKVGPMQITYKGKASFADVDEEKHRATIEARGQETRGSGTAQARITASLDERGDQTEVNVVTDLTVTGKPAQFGRGVMADVGEKLLGQFADCLAEELSGPEEVEPEKADEERVISLEEPAPAAAPPPTAQPVGPAPRRTDEAIDLLDVAGAPVAKRAAPALAAAALLALIVWLIRRRR